MNVFAFGILSSCQNSYSVHHETVNGKKMSRESRSADNFYENQAEK